MFPGTLGIALAGKALEKKIWSLNTINIRDFATGVHKSVDDTPYGGGAGMVMRPDVVGRAIETLPENTPLYYLSPRGQPLTQKKVKELAKNDSIGLLCGRYEGLDERVLKHYNITEISIGDYVLSGGEVAAQVILDAILRLREGFMGDQTSLNQESFENNLLEYPQYTRPNVWKNLSVPEILLSGHHEKIEQWRQKCSEELTKERRPDLWAKTTEIK
ncbi:MAG: tRNA (guanosine(37)-N1)-methyltransferase TrmD [Alphaproteobacteria bacterium]|nr:tRNA (guanosine(37)-N1)-methyltransferase TrmD [Alphaproteobacteria bacterium]